MRNKQTKIMTLFNSFSSVWASDVSSRERHDACARTEKMKQMGLDVVFKMVLKCAIPGCPNREKPTRKHKNALPMPHNEWLAFHTFPSYDR